ncbi:tRNA lysidine(34) synthetase TilS [Oceanimonas sp. CHS3-5]|uniref:tRNA lysidine(34) synthetase TilS n=1 Tax=Oceanimonas sp. CHS3-5 TaxID=3068186 RepID=UPI00273EE6F3|nr:tRNA lysidine(34) synthetase TilS [Oceanimonas sp. CHS3-5]MDP5291634.1 tRNA lysidine(34) synthetase TilS [Oceanimonas sp. CHS3-5]
MTPYEHLRLCLNTHAPEGPLYVAYSGGLDSTVLLALTARLATEQQRELVALHVHHGLQAVAEAWPAHCRQVAERLGVPFRVLRVKVDTGPRVSTEAAARNARYAALAAELPAGAALLTGHHLDDQAETLLLALKRGAGIKGLAAMPASKPLGRGVQLRPLLQLSRNELESFATEQGLSWVEDPSNADNRFDRNFLRNDILPRLLAQWPAFARTASRSAELCAEQLELAQALAEQDLRELETPANGLSIAGLEQLGPARRNNALRHWLSKRGLHLSRSQLEVAWTELALARADADPVLDIGGKTLRRYQQHLYVPELKEQPVALALIEPEQWEDLGVGRLRMRRDRGEAVIRGDLPLNELHIAFGVTGLRAQPVGRSGSRPLKKLWQEYGVPPWQRPRVPLLMHKDKLVAAVGLFVCADYAAEPGQTGWQLEWAPGTQVARGA